MDPDSWLNQLDGLHLERKVDRHGMISIDLKRYYVSSKLVGRRVVAGWMPSSNASNPCPCEDWWGTCSPLSSFSRIWLCQARLRSLQERKYRTAAFTVPWWYDILALAGLLCG